MQEGKRPVQDLIQYEQIEEPGRTILKVIINKPGFAITQSDIDNIVSNLAIFKNQNIKREEVR